MICVSLAVEFEKRAKLAAEQAVLQEKLRIQNDAFEQQIMDALKKFQSGEELLPNDVLLLVKTAENHAGLVEMRERIHGYTLLHWCARLGLDQAATNLVRLGANAAALNEDGKKSHELSRGTALTQMLESAAKLNGVHCS